MIQAARRYAAGCDAERAVQLSPEADKAYYSRGCVRFLMGEYVHALNDFKQALQINTDHHYTAGLAVAYHALGGESNTDEARNLWARLVAGDERYADADWLHSEFGWPEPLMAEARQVIALVDRET
jgi:tetratricopeptide (TPR) repeat protein